LWVLAGALFKLFAGSPNDIPGSVFEYSPLGPVDTFRVAIGIEISIVALALFKPQLGWLPLALMFVIFDLVLWPLVQAGEASCGCFGSSITIPPAVMMAIDTGCLLALLVGRPWSALRLERLNVLPLVPLFVLAFAAPWYKFKTTTTAPKPRPEPRLVVDEGDDGQPEQVEPAQTGEVPVDDSEPWVWTLPDPLPDFHWFEPTEWEGQLLYDIDLYTFLDVDLIPPDAHVVFYRQTCDHCKEHLEEMALQPVIETMLVLVRIVEVTDSPETNVIHMKPDGAIELELPALERGYGITTPLSIDVEGMLVTKVTNHRDEE